jgi:hypothetical protein
MLIGNQLDSFFLDFIGGVMGQSVPVGDLAAQVKGKPANAEMGIPALLKMP